MWPLSSSVSLHVIIQAMLYLSPLPPSCSSVGSGAFLGVCGFLVFLASSARSACASSFCFCSAVCLRSIFGLAAVANRSVKPTRLRRAAYFRSLGRTNMRIASRHMPKYQAKPPGLLGWGFVAALASAFAYIVFAEPEAIAVVLAILVAAYLVSRPGCKRAEEQLRKLAAAREGQSICEFARDFDLKAVDSWIVRAVYEQVQQQLAHIHPAFPLRAEDRLKEDLHIDVDDLDMDVAVEVEQRTGRSLKDADANPYFGKVQTVRDLVLFFQHQPLRGAA